LHAKTEKEGIPARRPTNSLLKYHLRQMHDTTFTAEAAKKRDLNILKLK
jgi:hypothetical protein